MKKSPFLNSCVILMDEPDEPPQRGGSTCVGSKRDVPLERLFLILLSTVVDTSLTAVLLHAIFSPVPIIHIK